MDGGGVRMGTRRTLKQRLGFIGIGCCGASWMYRQRPTIVAAVDRAEEDDRDNVTSPGAAATAAVDNTCEDAVTNPAGAINLAAALAAEREYRAEKEVATPLRVSLMKLLEEPEEGGRAVAMVVGNDKVCCVCMGREKGAAFIPCGHTFCRVCSMELWVNRGSCPLCNRSILEILHIF